ncbi:MAG TPA: bifunctional phosphoglucose/phosphomannose isomerase [Candidatus Thermoplasmatota archaeon]|nr:bifunctional phosphoglucose/phosphomannose isomerase [Candidatus Thermoplasmatota archaeon]
MLDIAAADVLAADPSDMLGAVLRWPEALAEATREPAPPRIPRPSRVLVVGLGGSAISGDYAARWADRVGPVPVLVRRGYDVPAWVDSSTLVVAVSYSGGTEETLSSFVAARKRGARLVGVGTGGELKRFAERARAPFVPVRAGLQPRAAMPHVLARLADVLEAAEVLPGARDEIEAAIPHLQKLVQDLAADAPPSRNEAKRTALALEGTVPAVYAADHLGPVARRFANQLNENAKVVAFHGEMPEMNHNELVGWSEDDDLDRLTMVLLRHAAEIPQVQERFEFTAQVVQARGGRVVQHAMRGHAPLAEALAHTILADAVSIYLAAIRRKDPTPVSIIARLKEKVAALGLTQGLAHAL